MNRIIIIGNGFDLAHGLPTRYEDFINWYWEQRIYGFNGNITDVDEDPLCILKIKKNDWYNITCWNVVALQRYNMFPNAMGTEIFNSMRNKNELFEVIPSELLERITYCIEEKGWVDIENEYYNLLKNTIIKDNNALISIKTLNNQLLYIQYKLTEYLLSIQGANICINPRIRDLILQSINISDISISGLTAYYNHCDSIAAFGRQEWVSRMNEYGLTDILLGMEFDNFKKNNTYTDAAGIVKIKDYSQIPLNYIRPHSTLLLSFNYTSVTDWYQVPSICFPIHIHGDLSNPANMIFGYGDELDEGYNRILRLNDNEYLQNIKSIKYLDAANYRNVLGFIESAPFQVYIMGHSCGNSDRTLLNTIFEHNNCVSIKPFYHIKKDNTDNYLDIVQNICRNFTDMKLMRDRVVNKTFCEPLPQVHR